MFQHMIYLSPICLKCRDEDKDPNMIQSIYVVEAFQACVVFGGFSVHARLLGRLEYVHQHDFVG